MAILLRPFIKYGLMALAVIAVVFGIYEYGHSQGYSSGYSVAWATQQKTIQAMVDKQNAQTLAQNNKIDKVEAQSQTTAQANQVAQQQQVVTVTQVVTKYVHDNPKTSQTCGWDTGAVAAINSIIDSGSTTTAGVQNEHVQQASTERVPHLRVAVRMRGHSASAVGHTVAYRATGTEGRDRSTSTGQVPIVAQADTGSLQSGTVFVYPGDLRDDVRYVPSPSDILVGPDLGRVQPHTSAGATDPGSFDTEQYGPELHTGTGSSVGTQLGAA
jgi:hypothetical protein